MKTYTYSIKVHKADPDETGFWVEVPALPGCFTQGETYDEAVRMPSEAIQLYVEGLIEEGLPIPIEHVNQGAEQVNVTVNLPSAA